MENLLKGGTCWKALKEMEGSKQEGTHIEVPKSVWTLDYDKHLFSTLRMPFAVMHTLVPKYTSGR